MASPDSMFPDLSTKQLLYLINTELHDLHAQQPRRRKQLRMCYICSRLDPGDRFKGENSHWRLYRKGFFQNCRHNTPASPCNTLNDVAEDDEDDERGDDVGRSQALFNTKILSRDLDPDDPRFFNLPPIFDTPRSKNELDRQGKGNFIPVTSERTFLSTRVHRKLSQSEDLDEKKGSRKTSRRGRSDTKDSLILPDVPPGIVNLVMTHDESPYATYEDGDESIVALGKDALGPLLERKEGDKEEEKENTKKRRRKRGQERVPKHPSFGPWGEDSTMDKSIIRHHERQQQRRLLPDGAGNDLDRRRRRRRRKRDDLANPGSEEQEFGSDFYSDFSDDRSWSSQELMFSRETTAEGDNSSPSMLVSQLRALSWCECPNVDLSTARCQECFQVDGHKQWCVSRSLTCGTCGKVIRQVKVRRRSSNAFEATTSDPNSAHARDKCSANGHRRPRPKVTTGKVKVTFQDDVEQREISPYQGDDNDVGGVGIPGKSQRSSKGQQPPEVKPGSHLPTYDPDIHRHAYTLALADVKTKLFNRRPDDVIGSGFRGPVFSYFPPWQYKGHNSLNPADLGLRHPGKSVKVKKGLKHILGSVDIGDYYPGGKKNPRTVARLGGERTSKKGRPLTD